MVATAIGRFFLAGAAARSSPSAGNLTGGDPWPPLRYFTDLAIIAFLQVLVLFVVAIGRVLSVEQID
jgi:hypothetical protein